MQFAHLRNLTISSTPGGIELGQHRESNGDQEGVDDLKAFLCLENIANIADSESQPPPPPVHWTEKSPGAGTPLSEHIAVRWECGAQGCLETNLQHNAYYLFVTCEEYE